MSYASVLRLRELFVMVKTYNFSQRKSDIYIFFSFLAFFSFYSYSHTLYDKVPTEKSCNKNLFWSSDGMLVLFNIFLDFLAYEGITLLVVLFYEVIHSNVQYCTELY